MEGVGKTKTVPILEHFELASVVIGLCWRIFEELLHTLTELVLNQ